MLTWDNYCGHPKYYFQNLRKLHRHRLIKQFFHEHLVPTLLFDNPFSNEFTNGGKI
jgi:hypothetical protein